MEEQNTNEQQNQEQQAQPAPQQAPASGNDGKTVAILSYITLIGWIVALVMHGNDKTELGAFHIRQALGIGLTGLVGYIVLMIIPLLGWILIPVWGICILVMAILGLIAAANGEMKPVPVVGEFIQKTLAGLK